MKEKLTPQEKKTLSYKKDCRYSYGESNKGSRKTVPRRKKNVNRSFRRKTQSLELKNIAAKALDDDSVQTKIDSLYRKDWKKVNDIPLQEHIKSQLFRRVLRFGRKEKHSSKAIKTGYLKGFGKTHLNSVDQENILAGSPLK